MRAIIQPGSLVSATNWRGPGGSTDPAVMAAALQRAGGEPPPPTGDWALGNVPAGMTLVADTDHTTLTPGGWAFAERGYSPDPVVVAEASPVASAFVRQSWEGVVDGQSPNYLYHSLGNASEIYFGSIMRLSPAWLWHILSYGCKWHTILTSNGAGWMTAQPFNSGRAGTTGWPWTDQIGRASSAWWPLNTSHPEGGAYVLYETASGDMVQANPSAVETVNGEWFKLECHVNFATGAVRHWINDVLTGDSTAEGFSWSFPGGTLAQQLQLGSTMGGGNGLGTLTADYYADYARTAIYRRA